jgi:hypothetical protein
VIGQQAAQLRQPLAGVVELEEPLRVEGTDGRRSRRLEAGLHGIIVQLDTHGLRRLSQLSGHREHALEEPFDVGADIVCVGPRLRLAEELDVGTRERIVGKPRADAEATGTDGREQIPAIGKTPGRDDAGDRSDGEPRVTPTDLAPTLDEDDAELTITGEACLGEGAIARLEDV